MGTDGHRNVRLLAGGASFAVALAAFLRIPLLPDIGHDLSLSSSEVSLLVTAFAVGRLVMDFPAGWIADTVPARLALAATGLGVAAGSAGLALSHSLVAALASSFAIGAASSVTNSTSMRAFASAPAARRGAAMAMFTTALLAGQTFGPAAGGALTGLGGWRGAIAAGAAIGVAVALVSVLWRPEPPAPVAAAEHDPRPAGDEQPAGPGLSRLELLVLGAVPFGSFFAMGGVTQTLVPLVGSGQLSLSAGQIGLALGAAGMSRFVGAWVAGFVSDRVSRKAALVPGLWLMAGGVALLVLPVSRLSWVAAIAVLSFASSGVSVAATMIADRVPAATLGRSLATFRFTGDFGLLAGPAVVGVLYQHSGRPAAAIASAALLALCALAVAALVREGAARRHATVAAPGPG